MGHNNWNVKISNIARYAFQGEMDFKQFVFVAVVAIYLYIFHKHLASLLAATLDQVLGLMLYRTAEVTKDLKLEDDDIDGSRDDSAKEEGTMPIQKLVVQPPLDGLDSDTILCMEVGDSICFS